MADEPITVTCPQCGGLIEVADPRAWILAVHLAEVCPQTTHWLHQE